MFPFASRLLTHERSRDFFIAPLDHYLTPGQQVAFQSLELQEVPISPLRLPLMINHQVNHQRTWTFARVKLTTEPVTSSTSIQMLFVFPGLTYMTTPHDNQPERPIISWLARNLTWPMAGRYHTKPFFTTRPPERITVRRCMLIAVCNHL